VSGSPTSPTSATSSWPSGPAVALEGARLAGGVGCEDGRKGRGTSRGLSSHGARTRPSASREPSAPHATVLIGDLTKADAALPEG